MTYRESGNQRVRSLRTKDRREALKLKRAIETKLEERGTLNLIVSDKPVEVYKNAPLSEFWSEFRSWAAMHRSRRAVEEYTVWFKQFEDFANVDRMGEANMFVKTMIERRWIECQMSMDDEFRDPDVIQQIEILAMEFQDLGHQDLGLLPS